MPQSVYTFSESVNFSGGLDTFQFQREIINDGTIGGRLDGLRCAGDVVDIIFSSALSSPTETDLLNSLIAAHDPKVAVADIALPGKVYESESALTSSTTSSNWQEKLMVKTIHIPAGRYGIKWYYRWDTNSTTDAFFCRVMLDNTTSLHYQEELSQQGDLSRRNPRSGFKSVSLTEGVHYVTIEFHSENGTNVEIEACSLCIGVK